MTFGEYLKFCAKEWFNTISAFEKKNNLNHGQMSMVYKSELTMSEDAFYRMLLNSDFPSEVEDNLISLYYKSIEGVGGRNRDKLEKQLLISNLLKNDLTKPNQEIWYPAPEQVGIKAKSRKEIFDAINNTISKGENIIANFSFLDEELDSFIFNSLKHSSFKSFIFFIDLNYISSLPDNLKIMTAVIKYVFIGCMGRYNHVDIGKKIYGNLFPYYILSEKQAFFFNGKNGIMVTDTELVEQLKSVILENKKNYVPFNVKFDSILEYKDAVENANAISSGKKRSAAIIRHYCGYPCLAWYFDNYEDLYLSMKEGIPDAEFRVKKVIEHYKSVYSDIGFSEDLFSEDGLKLFAKTGNVCEFPSEFKKPFTVELRIKYLKYIYNDIEKGRIKIFNTEKFSLQNKMSITVAEKSIQFYSIDVEKDDFFAGEEFMAVVEDKGMIEDFQNYYDTLIKTDVFYSKTRAKNIVNDIIIDLESKLKK